MSQVYLPQDRVPFFLDQLPNEANRVVITNINRRGALEKLSVQDVEKGDHFGGEMRGRGVSRVGLGGWVITRMRIQQRILRLR